MLFTESYGEQSCTAAAHIHHRAERLPHRPVQSRVPGITVRHKREDCDDRETAQETGLCDRSVRQKPPRRLKESADGAWFRRIFGNLYHLDAEEEPELATMSEKDLPTARKVRTSPSDPFMGDRRGRLTEEPRWGKVGKQKIEETGPLNTNAWRHATTNCRWRQGFITRQNEADQPFFVWLNTTHMHLLTHPKPESLGQAGSWHSPYHDTMIDHDKNVGGMLDLSTSSASR